MKYKILYKLLKTKVKENLIYLGTEYGGWHCAPKLIDSNGLLISAGAGEDISFDIELAKLLGKRIYILDPTPKAIEHFKTTEESIKNNKTAYINNDFKAFYECSESTMKLLTFIPSGLWKNNQIMNFYSPRDPSHVSHSIDNLQNSDNYFEAQCITLSSLCEQLGNKNVTLLKMDIEGSEFDVIKHILFSSKIRPDQLLIEFHSNTILGEAKIFTYCILLKLFKYSLIKKSKSDFVFIQTRLLNTF